MRFCTSLLLDPLATMVVFSLSMLTLTALPSISRETVSRLKPISNEMTRPSVRIAMSSSICLRRSPKPGAFTAAAFKTPRALFTTRVAKASPSKSSAMMRRGLLARDTFSRMGTKSAMALIFLSVISRRGFSNSTTCRS